MTTLRRIALAFALLMVSGSLVALPAQAEAATPVDDEVNDLGEEIRDCLRTTAWQESDVSRLCDHVQRICEWTAEDRSTDCRPCYRPHAQQAESCVIVRKIVEYVKDELKECFTTTHRDDGGPSRICEAVKHPCRYVDGTRPVEVAYCPTPEPCRVTYERGAIRECLECLMTKADAYYPVCQLVDYVEEILDRVRQSVSV